MNTRQKLSLSSAGIFILVGAVSAALVIGKESRLVDVMIVYFSGFAAGASVVAFIKGKR